MKEREADTPWFTQKTNKALDTGLASLTKAPGSVLRRVKAQGAFLEAWAPRRVSKTGLCTPKNQPRGEREREKERHGVPSSDGAKVL